MAEWVARCTVSIQREGNVMTTYSKTIYIEVEADNETDAMNAVYAALENATEDPVITNVDYDGPMEEVADPDEDAPETPAQRLREYIEEYPNLNGTSADDVYAELTAGDTMPRYLLVESNVRGGYWLELFDDPGEAADYAYNQEYAGDWEVEELVDLLRGDVYDLGDVKIDAQWKVRSHEAIPPINNWFK